MKKQLEFTTVFFINEGKAPDPVIVRKSGTVDHQFKMMPDNLPNGWLVFNAPRPIYGTWLWEGDFRHGIFYAALDPESNEAAALIKRNHELDASIVEYWTMPDIRAAVIEYYKQEYRKSWPRLVEMYGGEKLPDAPDTYMVRTFVENMDNKKVVEIDGKTGGLL